MMGRQDEPEQLFYQFRFDRYVSSDHLLRRIDAVLDLSTMRRALAPYYATIGRPSVDPELMIRMLLIGYSFGIRSERRLCEEVHLNLAYRWFCRLGLKGMSPITRRSRRIGMGAFVTVICSASFSRKSCVYACSAVSSAVKGSRSMRA
jgi:transposase